MKKFPKPSIRLPRGYGWVRDPKKFLTNKIYYFFNFNLLRWLLKNK